MALGQAFHEQCGRQRSREELIPALRCPQVSARDHFESSWVEGSVIQSAKFEKGLSIISS